MSEDLKKLEKELYERYLRKCCDMPDPWHRSELRNSAYVVKEVLREAFKERGIEE